MNFETVERKKMNSLSDILRLEHWIEKDHNPFLIAGPCSAETEEQVYQAFREIKQNVPFVNIMRAGVWKPRTRPNSFEGVGEIALPWIVAAAKEIAVPVSVEVANQEHVEAALKAGVDALWIGARTTVSPFNIQAIADALSGVDIPVFIKNPVNPDVELWIGAFERFANKGIVKLAAIHRGFSTYEKSNYRNPPMWEIPIELRRRYPNISIIVDPSHMGGDRNLIFPLSQQALDMGFDGLMIESHPDPDKAWSDARQQVAPSKLSEILKQLIIRKPKLDTAEYKDLNELRGKIDRIDDYIVELIGERMSISGEIGAMKKEKSIAIHQSERWSRIVENALEKGEAVGLSREFIIKFFQQIHNESIYHQTKVFEGELKSEKINS